MKQVITINEKQITIRGVKFKEVKEFSGMAKEKIDSLFHLLDAEDIFSGLNSC